MYRWKMTSTSSPNGAAKTRMRATSRSCSPIMASPTKPSATANSRQKPRGSWVKPSAAKTSGQTTTAAYSPNHSIRLTTARAGDVARGWGRGFWTRVIPASSHFVRAISASASARRGILSIS